MNLIGRIKKRKKAEVKRSSYQLEAFMENLDTMQEWDKLKVAALERVSPETKAKYLRGKITFDDVEDELFVNASIQNGEIPTHYGRTLLSNIKASRKEKQKETMVVEQEHFKQAVLFKKSKRKNVGV